MVRKAPTKLRNERRNFTFGQEQAKRPKAQTEASKKFVLNEKDWSWIFPPNGRRNVKVTFEKPIHLASLEEGRTFDVNADLVNGMKPYNFKVIEKEGSLITASADVVGKPNEQVILVIGFGKSKTRFSFFYDDGGTTYVDHNVIAMYDVLLPKEPTK